MKGGLLRPIIFAEMELFAICRRLRLAKRWFISLLYLCLALSPAWAGKMPPGSFLCHPVTRLDDLLLQFEHNALVRERYVRLYASPPSHIRRAFAKMRLTRLSQDRILRVFYVHPGEVIGYKLRRVRRGTQVLTQTNGSPALIAACGNPVRTDLEVEHMPPKEREKLIVPEFEPTEPLHPLPGSPEETLYAAFGGGDTMDERDDTAFLFAPPNLSAPFDLVLWANFLDPLGIPRASSERPRTPEPSVVLLVLSMGIASGLWGRRLGKCTAQRATVCGC
jgi:hypothetical protein